MVGAVPGPLAGRAPHRRLSSRRHRHCGVGLWLPDSWTARRHLRPGLQFHKDASLWQPVELQLVSHFVAEDESNHDHEECNEEHPGALDLVMFMLLDLVLCEISLHGLLKI